MEDLEKQKIVDFYVDLYIKPNKKNLDERKIKPETLKQIEKEINSTCKKQKEQK